MKFLFTCGGTAGHVNPALAIAQRIREIMPDSEILFVGAKGNMETELVPREGFPITTVTITNIQRSFKPDKILHNLKTFKNIITSEIDAKRIIRKFAPDAAIGTGGYVCYPVIKAANSLGIPTALHESNAIPGLTTKMLQNKVDRIFVGFEESRENYSHPERVEVVGTPVRTDFTALTQEQAKEKLGIPADKKFLVSVWGSLGASFMNEMMVGFIERAVKKPDFALVHSTGKSGYEAMCKRLHDKGCNDYAEKGMDVREYIYDMPTVMAAADLVLCRSGASTLSELTLLGKPAILIPSPNVTNNHQEKNARVLENAGGAKVLLEGGFSVDSLMGTVSDLLNKPEELGRMSDCMKSLCVKDSADRIAGAILEMAHNKQ